MIGFLLRKTLYDLWDNMFRIVVLNLGFFICTSILLLPILLPQVFDTDLFAIVLGVLGTLLCCVYLSAAAYTVKVISDYGNFTFRDFFSNFKKSWLAGIAMFLYMMLLFYLVSVALPSYFVLEPQIVGLPLFGIILWLIVFSLLSFQYYFSVYSRLGGKVIKSFKKCMILSIDNTGMSIFLFIHSIATVLISFPFMFMFPGPVGVLLYLDEAIRLRILKYDWLEANPGANRRKIPWDEILIEERERTGTRSFRNFIFPWKD